MATPQEELEALRAQVAALAARIYELEIRAGLKARVHQGLTPGEAPPQNPIELATQPASPKETAATSVAPPPRAPQLSAAPASRRDRDDLEGTIGRLWFNRVGIFALLFGVAFFLKYAFDNNWIGPAGRITLGLLAGIAVVIWSERFRKAGNTLFSYSLKAVGIGTVYLSLWGAYQIYHLVPSAAAFAAMIVVTASTVTLALTQDAEILALYAIIGGFSTPVLLSTGENHEVVLFSYVLLLDFAMLFICTAKPWRRLLWGSFAGTWTLFTGWYTTYYNLQERPVTVVFAALFFAVFALIPLLTPLTRSRWHKGFSITLTALPLVNAATFFLSLYLMYWHETVTLTWYALGLAAVYLGLSSQFKKRVGSEPETVKLVNLLHVAIAIAFITIAIPLKLNEHWITIGWLVESAVLLGISVPARADFLRYFAAATLALGVFRLLVIDNFHVTTLVFNARFATYLVAVAILAGIVGAGERFASEAEKPALRIAGVALNLLALIALTLEAHDFFAREMAEFYRSNRRFGGYGPFQQIEFARNLTYSAIWLIYGAALMAFGFWRRTSFVRWQALVLISFTIAKVFLFDSSSLGKGYRIVSFMALGVVLMAISYVYSRDWLKLSRRSANAG
jgi:uncharacterized membrane protein